MLGWLFGSSLQLSPTAADSPSHFRMSPLMGYHDPHLHSLRGSTVAGATTGQRHFAAVDQGALDSQVHQHFFPLTILQHFQSNA